jgi:hypothetical protein
MNGCGKVVVGAASTVVLVFGFVLRGLGCQVEGEEGGGGGVRRASTREDIRRKLANFGDEQEEQRKTTEELSLNNNLEVGGVPHQILYLEFPPSSAVASSISCCCP